MGFHWPRGTHRTKPWSGGPRRVADRPHFDTHRLKTWRVHSPGGGKEESEEEEAVHPECMADCPCGGRPAVHLHGTTASMSVEPILGPYKCQQYAYKCNISQTNFYLFMHNCFVLVSLHENGFLPSSKLMSVVFSKTRWKKHNFTMEQLHNRKTSQSILSTCMGFTDKTKDNQKAMKDLAQLCNRPTLELKSSGGKSCVSFCLKSKEGKEVLIWLQILKFTDGYATGFSRVVNLESGKLSGVKSHDYHIFMERLIPVMFHGYLNDDVWKALAELRHFYRQL
jgi:hypothetical protein